MAKISTARKVDQPPVHREVERLDVAQLGRLVKERRGGLSLRQAAADAGVSFSTMSRVEAGSQPDLASFTKLCAWLGVAPSAFFTPVTEKASEPLENVMHHLYADPRLTPDAAEAISGVLKQMYSNLALTVEPAKRLVACHLRAAPVMRPGVPARLGALLTELHQELEALIDNGEL